MQHCLDLICNWATRWELKLSPSKCNALPLRKAHVKNLHHCCDVVLPRVSQMTDLDILTDDQLSCSPHIDSVCIKVKQRASIILNCSYSRNKYLLMKAFIVYVRPLLEYCCSVWSPSKLSLIDKLESIQRRFTKELHGLNHLSFSLNIDSLECRRIKANLIMFLKIFHELIDIDVNEFFVISNSNTRGHILKLNDLASIIMLRSLATDLEMSLNSLPDDVVNCQTLSLFIYKLKSCDIDKSCTRIQ